MEIQIEVFKEMEIEKEVLKEVFKKRLQIRFVGGTLHESNNLKQWTFQNR